MPQADEGIHNRAKVEMDVNPSNVTLSIEYGTGGSVSVQWPRATATERREAFEAMSRCGFLCSIFFIFRMDLPGLLSLSPSFNPYDSCQRNVFNDLTSDLDSSFSFCCTTSL